MVYYKTNERRRLGFVARLGKLAFLGRKSKRMIKLLDWLGLNRFADIYIKILKLFSYLFLRYFISFFSSCRSFLLHRQPFA